MHTTFVRPAAGRLPRLHGVRRLGVLALLALATMASALSPATAWGQLYGRPVAQPCFDFPNWARFSDCRPDPLPWGYDVFPDYGPTDCGCGPGGVACEVDFVAHRPSDWHAMAEFAPLTIDYQTDLDIASLGLGQAAVLDTGDFRPEFDSGSKFTVGRRIHDCYRLEGTYLGLYDWQDSIIVETTTGTPPATVTTTDAMSFASSLQSAEINLRYWAAMPPGPFDVSILVGARYLRIHEQFDFLGENPVGTTNALTVNTENDLVGLQIGIQGQCLKTTRWWFDFDLKGGIYTDDTTVRTDFSVDGGAATTASVDADRTAWVGDIALALNWQMTPQCAFRVGYQGIFINGLALAQNNAVANADLLGTTTARLDDSGEVTYHGPTIGIVWIR